MEWTYIENIILTQYKQISVSELSKKTVKIFKISDNEILIVCDDKSYIKLAASKYCDDDDDDDDESCLLSKQITINDLNLLGLLSKETMNQHLVEKREKRQSRKNSKMQRDLLGVVKYFGADETKRIIDNLTS